MLTAEDILTTKELEDFFAGRDRNATISEMLSDYRDLKTATDKAPGRIQFASHRLFCGDSLWTSFDAALRTLQRGGWLVHQSMEKKRYQDWRTDRLIDELVRSVLRSVDVEKGKEMQAGGFSYVFGCLRERVLREAIQVTEGLHGVERP